MTGIIRENYLLHSELAQVLYRSAEHEPIIDYHCHIDPQEIAENKQFKNITELWLGGDHYKWRVLRAHGVPESEITGSADDKVKFLRYAEVMPKLIGNPLYEWSHLELNRYFGYEGSLSPETAEEVWELCNSQLEDLRVRDLIEMSGVEAIVTTDDPIDSLKWHVAIGEAEDFGTDVYPGWRPDKALAIDQPTWPEYIQKLSEAASTPITDLASFGEALVKRLDHFDRHHCTSSDHGLGELFYAEASEDELRAIFEAGLRGEALSPTQIAAFRTHILLLLAGEYQKRGWVMQIHYGALRNINTRAFRELGPDTGFDVVGYGGTVRPLAQLLDAIEQRTGLPKLVVYPLNPHDQMMVHTVLGAFQGEGAPGKMQLGAAWWYNDTFAGMTEQLTVSASVGVLGNFIGMLTDSRSFLSYTRHEYFRRLLANFLADLVIQGRYPLDLPALEALMRDISVRNVRRFLGLD